jgi:maleylacetate reductase
VVDLATSRRIVDSADQTSRGPTTNRRSFDFSVLPQRIVFGAGRLRDLPTEIEQLGLHRILLIHSGSAKPAADQAAEALGERVVERLAETRQHVPATLADRASGVAVQTDADGVVTIGGGSATGLGKAVVVATGVPLIAVPTTYSGSEATPIYGITNGQKRTARDARALPSLVVYDATLTTGLPAKATGTSGLNALAHCVEAVYAPRSNPLTTLLALEGIRILSAALPVAVREPEGLPAREDALYAAYLAGSALATAGSGLHHVLCHIIGGRHALGHADVHAVLLPHVLAYNERAAASALAPVARILGRPTAAEGVHALARRLGTPTSLAELGMPADGLEEVAERTAQAVGTRNPRAVDTPSLRRLLDNAQHGFPPVSI